MKTVLMLLLSCFFLTSAKADSITYYFDFELKENEQLNVFIGRKLVYKSHYPGTRMFDSLKLANDSIKPELVIRQFGRKYREYYIITNWQILPEYRYVMFSQFSDKSKRNYASVYYYKNPLQYGRIYFCGTKDAGWLRRLFYRIFDND